MKFFPSAVLCTSLAFLQQAAANANSDIPKGHLLEEVPPLSCPEDALLCDDGTTLVRDPNNNCEFPSCTDGDELAEDVIQECSNDFKVCTEGMILFRDPLNNCKMPSCPIDVTKIPCGWFDFQGELICYNYGRDLPEGLNPWLEDIGCNTNASGNSVQSKIFCGANSNGDCEKTLVEEPCLHVYLEPEEEPEDEYVLSFPSGAFDGYGKSVVRSIVTTGVIWFLMTN